MGQILISQLISLTFLLSADPNIAYFKGNVPNFSRSMRGCGKKLAPGVQNRQYLRKG